MSKINKVLIANRGEIAVRIIRSLKEMGITTVAVYSEADRKAPHVLIADEAALLGPPPSGESYLNQQKIIEVCKDLQVDAIHPGYGFLSENAEFARAVDQAGINFIGPSAESIELMGSKIKAKEAVASQDVPMVPGSSGSVRSGNNAVKVAEDLGFPLLIKASAGGGGKGMRVVNSIEEFESQLERAVSEATSAFGDGSVFLERFIQAPKHIEVQILGDHHGNVVHLFERECSVQRRHQKVIEEAPSKALTPQLRENIGMAAVRVAQAAKYYGAGTVEFMLDDDENFYFLEMNTRLQVEHPVTELITGVDLVKEQIRIAEGKELSFKQEDLEIRGHAIEARVYAEDPENNFLPDTGTLEIYQTPKGPGVRVDDGYYQGMEIPIHYDPMIAKLIVYAENRDEAMRRMIRAIDEYRIIGLKTTLGFCRFVMAHDSFRSGDYNTHFIEDHYAPSIEITDNETQDIAVLMAAHMNNINKNRSVIASNNTSSAWKLRSKEQ